MRAGDNLYLIQNLKTKLNHKMYKNFLTFFTIFLGSLFLLASPLFSTDWYVRPAGGDYGAEDGTSYDTAWDGLLNVVWGSGGVQPGDTLWVCGLHVHDMISKNSIATQADINLISGTSESTRITIRGDYPGNEGIIWSAYRMNQEVWTDEGNGVWSIPLPGDSFPDWFFQDIGNPDKDSFIVLDKETSINGVINNPGSHYSIDYETSSLLYVKCTDGENPAERIYGNWWGYDFKLNGLQYVTFSNLKWLCPNRFFDKGEYATHITWEKCILAYGDHSIFGFRDHCHFMQVIECDISWAANGIYTISVTNDAPSYYLFKGNTIHDIGIRAINHDRDAHCFGIQGGTGGIIEDNICYNGGSGISFYTYTPQNLTNTIVRRNFIKDMHTLGGANNRGIETGCDYDSIGDKTGNIFHHNIIINVDLGLKFSFEDLQEVHNNIVYNCNVGLRAARSYDGYGPQVSVKNNIFLNSTTHHVLYGTGGTIYLADFDYNLYYPDGAQLFSYQSREHNFDGWQQEGQGSNSLLNDPLFFDPAAENFNLQNDSPAIDAGEYVGLISDFTGTSIPKGFAPDIGAYECIKSIFMRISAAPLSGTIPLTVNFLCEVIGEKPPFLFNWDFGDTQHSTAQNPSHIYTASSTYIPSMTVSDNQNNTETGSLSITAYPSAHNLSISSLTEPPAPSAGGTTNPSHGIYLYPHGSSLPVRAVPNPNYRFFKWTGDIYMEIYNASSNIIMDQNKSITANFSTQCGDVNGDSSITPTDAQAAFDIFLGKLSLTTLAQRENADVNCDGTVSVPNITPADAQAIFDKFLGRSELPCDCSGGSRAAVDISVNKRESDLKKIYHDFEKDVGETLTIPINVEDINSIQAFGFDFFFPSDQLEYAGILPTKSSRDFTQIDAYEISHSMLRVGGYRNTINYTGDSKALITFIFKSKKKISGRLFFTISNAVDDLKTMPFRQKKNISNREKRQ